MLKTQELSNLIIEIEQYFNAQDDLAIKQKKDNNTWSKQEILGHLCDSAINNLKRFTDVQDATKPFVYFTYNQNHLVAVNQYNELAKQHLIDLYKAINHQILVLFNAVSEDNMNIKFEYSDGRIVTLKYVMNDYVDHMSHHLAQLKER
jgi:hypothetical protein